MVIGAIKKLFVPLSWFGLDFRVFLTSFFEIPRYLRDRRNYSLVLKNHKEWPMAIYPIFLDRNTDSASLGEYFWQDFLVAKQIISQNPRRHIDVGSRIDGFIAHLACVRNVEVLDIRPLSAKIENVDFTQWDITDPDPALNGVADCVSCLHTVEHIGLGRYGDKLDPDGWRKGLKSLINLVAPGGGGLWLSVPIGIQRVEFNAHRIFDPITIIHAAGKLGMKLCSFFYLTDSGFIESSNVARDVEMLASKSYGLGIFFFTKD